MEELQHLNKWELPKLKQQAKDMGNQFGSVDDVVLKPYDNTYPEKFATERLFLLKLFDENIASVDHVGSSAIPTIWGKPIVDIAIVIQEFPLDLYSIDKLKSHQYIYWDTNPDLSHQFFFKGLPRTYHLHFHPVGHQKPYDQICFRDYLLGHPAKAKEYEDLKIRLAKLYSDDREKYTDMKAEFVASVLNLCKK